MAHKYSEQELITELRRLEDELGAPPTAQEMNEKGKHAASTYSSRFGGWNESLQKAGLDINKKYDADKDEMLSAICELAEQLDRPPKYSEMNELGEFSVGAYNNQFGTWRDAVREAGYEPHRVDKKSVKCHQCGADFKKYAAHIERGDHDFCTRGCYREWRRDKKPIAGEEHYNWKGGGRESYYGPNWEEQRKAAKKRDSYKCQECGISEERHVSKYGSELEVHHRTPLREFLTDGIQGYKQANKLANLITYCKSCHSRIEILQKADKARSQ